MGFEPVADKDGRLSKMLIRESTFGSPYSTLIIVQGHNQGTSTASRSTMIEDRLQSTQNYYGSSHRRDCRRLSFTLPPLVRPDCCTSAICQRVIYVLKGCHGFCITAIYDKVSHRIDSSETLNPAYTHPFATLIWHRDRL
jgi:hypothetical protein